MKNNYYRELNLTLMEIDEFLSENALYLETYTCERILQETYQVLNEATINKEAILKGLDALSKAMKDLMNKFTETFRGLVKSNKEWLAEKLDTNIKNVDVSKLTFKMYPYWDGIDKLVRVTIPNYNSNDKDILENNLPEFRKKYFRDAVDKDGGFTNTKDIFRGAEDEKELVKDEVTKAYIKALGILKDFEKVATKISAENKRIDAVLQTAIKNMKSMNINESTLIENTMFNDGMFGILLEATTPVTSKTLSDDKGEQKEAPKEDNVNVSENMAMKNYARECYKLNSIRMTILEEAYDKCTKLVQYVTKGKKKEK